MARRISLGVWAAVALGGLVAAPALASTSLALDMRELVEGADHVVVGTVVGQRSSYDARRRIVTDVTVRVDDAMKGGRASGDELVVRCLGGVIGDLGMRVPGEPRFADGQRSVLFLVERNGHLRTVGMSQGVLPIDIEDGGRELVLPGGSGMSLVQRVQGGRLVPAPAALVHPRPLSDVLVEIRTLVDESGR